MGGRASRRAPSWLALSISAWKTSLGLGWSLGLKKGARLRVTAGFACGKNAITALAEPTNFGRHACQCVGMRAFSSGMQLGGMERAYLRTCHWVFKPLLRIHLDSWITATKKTCPSLALKQMMVIRTDTAEARGKDTRIWLFLNRAPRLNVFRPSDRGVIVQGPAFRGYVNVYHTSETRNKKRIQVKDIGFG